MKRLFALMLMLLMVFFAGCVTDDEDDEEDGGSGTSQSAATYLPFKQGASWTFSETETDYWSGTPETSTATYTTTCVGTQIVNNKTYWAMLDSDEDEYTLLRIVGNDVYMTMPEEIFKAAPKAIAAKLASEIVDEVVYFRFNVNAGTTWTIVNESETEEGFAYSFVMTGKYVGLESITTQAGLFADCAKFEFTTTSSHSYQGGSYSWTEVNCMWFAPNIGPIKDTDRDTDNGTLSYESVAILTSYSL